MKPNQRLAALLFLALVLGGLATALVRTAPKAALASPATPASVPQTSPTPLPAQPPAVPVPLVAASDRMADAMPSAFPTRLTGYKQLANMLSALGTLVAIAPAGDPRQEAARQRLSQQEARLAAFGEELFTELAGDAKSLDELATFILTAPNLKPRDLPLALRAAKAAYDLNGTDADITDTYARALFMTGDTAQAIVLQTKAVALQPDATRKAVFAATHKEYERAATALKNHEAAPPATPAPP